MTEIEDDIVKYLDKKMRKSNDCEKKGVFHVDGSDIVDIWFSKGRYESVLKGYIEIDGEVVPFKIQVDELIPLALRSRFKADKKRKYFHLKLDGDGNGR